MTFNQPVQHYNHHIETNKTCPTPRCLDAFSSGGELFLLLEDLSTRGFDQLLYNTSWNEVVVVLRWLAHFHARYMNSTADGLWECGTYWHLATRPEELQEIEHTRLHTLAPFIDARLRNSPFQSIVHGDAKLANFCFHRNRKHVAAVDFQYVGKGCGMKDVAYFVGSCMDEQQCEEHEDEILRIYFAELRSQLLKGKW